MREPHRAAAAPAVTEFSRVPGLFRRWEFGQVIEAGIEFQIEEAAPSVDGTELFVLYRREPGSSGIAQSGPKRPVP